MRIAQINAYIGLNDFQFCLRYLKKQFLNNERICKCMVFGVKSASAVGGAVINMIINRWLTFPFRKNPKLSVIF